MVRWRSVVAVGPKLKTVCSALGFRRDGTGPGDQFTVARSSSRNCRDIDHSPEIGRGPKLKITEPTPDHLPRDRLRLT